MFEYFYEKYGVNLVLLYSIGVQRSFYVCWVLSGVVRTPSVVCECVEVFIVMEEMARK